jgi:hypothetical protein
VGGICGEVNEARIDPAQLLCLLAEGVNRFAEISAQLFLLGELRCGVVRSLALDVQQSFMQFAPSTLRALQRDHGESADRCHDQYRGQLKPSGDLVD